MIILRVKRKGGRVKLDKIELRDDPLKNGLEIVDEKGRQIDPNNVSFKIRERRR